ncbi:MAG: type III-B CRISPR-associated protein Cas10/Cmr2 [Candidatus Methanodesulfokora sp.]
MEKSVKLEELLLLKTAALLHDPPDKAWCLIRRESHEKRAEELAGKMLENTSLEKAVELLSDKRVKEADRLVASVDRILLGKLIGERSGALPVRRVKLKNPLNPSYEVELSDYIDEEKVERVAKKINEILKQTDDMKSAYLALYGLYELIWIQEGLPSGPADTRIPTHTVFDHLYATASAVNWTYGKRGSLLYLDVAGVQNFISFSRKLRDLWASSYMISAFLWSLALDFVEEYGPDVVLIPTCRFNPFFLHSLAGKIQQIKSYVLEATKAIGYDIKKEHEDGWIYPRFAMIPGSMTLILPPLEDAESYVEKSFREKWKKFYDEIRKLKEKDEKLAPLIERLEDAEEKGYGFSEVPPFLVRASSVVKDAIEPFHNLYSDALDEIREKNQLKRILKIDPASSLPLSDLTERIFRGEFDLQSKRGFDYCSMCGRLPSVVSGPAEPYVSEGEKLCPYCLIKRVFSFKLSGALRAILGYGDGEILVEFPSLADIATFDFRDDILKKSREIDRKCREDPELKDLLRKADEVLEEIKRQISVWRYRKRKFDELGSIDIDTNLKKILSKLVLSDAEDSILRTGTKKTEKVEEKAPRDYWREVRRKLEERGISISSINTYYALIKTDGDDVTRIMEGRMGRTEEQIKNYIESSFEGKSREIIKKVLEGDLDSAKKTAKDEGLDERNIDELYSYITNEIIKKGKIPETISYHTSISRALIITALKDINLIENKDGVVVYAGGDDLLAITTVRNSMEVVRDTRKEYFGTRGFHKFVSYYMPSMGDSGRSYSIYIAHYKYPLYTVIRDSSDKIEDIAKNEKYLWMDCGRTGRKDSLVITYSPRGSPISSVVPLSLRDKDGNFILTDVPDLINDIRARIYEREEIPSSLLYRLSEESFLSSLRMAFNSNPDIYRKLVEHMIERHVGNEEVLRKLMEKLEKYMFLRREAVSQKDEERKFLIVEIFRSCKLLLGGLRGD